MAVSIDRLNFDEFFKYTTVDRKADIVYINDLNDVSNEVVANLVSVTRGQTLSTAASCLCGSLKGNYRKGELCPQCETRVTNQMDLELIPKLWFRCPPRVSKLFTPYAWHQITLGLHVAKCPHVLTWLTNPRFKVPKGAEIKHLHDVESTLKEIGLFKRDFNFFVSNFYEIIAALMSMREYRRGRIQVPVDSKLEMMLDRLGDDIFCQQIPFLNKSMITVEAVNTNSFIVDPLSFKVFNAINTLVRLQDTDSDATVSHKIVNAYNELAGPAIGKDKCFFESFFYVAGTKTGILRKNIYSSRLNFTGRAVIITDTTNRPYDSLVMPWVMAVEIYECEIINKLTKRGYTWLQALKVKEHAATNYSPLIHTILKELVKESFESKGLPVLAVRFPSIYRGSMFVLYVDSFHTDLNIKSLGVSALILPQCNGDIDGDEFSIYSIKSIELFNKLKYLESHYNAIDLSRVRKLSSNINLPKPLVSTLLNWHLADTPVDKVKVANMKLKYG